MLDRLFRFQPSQYVKIYQGNCLDVLSELPEEYFYTCVTSPPYFGLRDYQVDGQIGAEATPGEYVDHLVEVFRRVRRVLRDDGTVWLNLGDSYANDGKWGGSSGGKHAASLHGNSGIGRRRRHTGLKPKDLIGIPWRVAFALQADGWYLRQDIIWHKGNVMPESVHDRCTKAHEYIFLLSKGPRYYFDNVSIKEPFTSDQSHLRNRRSVWSVNTRPYRGAHFATFPPDLIRPCITAGCPEGGHVLDPFGGAGTTGLVARSLNRKADLIELNPDYVKLAKDRLFQLDEIR